MSVGTYRTFWNVAHIEVVSSESNELVVAMLDNDYSTFGDFVITAADPTR